MNATETTREYYLKMREMVVPQKRMTAEKAKVIFFQHPCQGCGSMTHSLIHMSKETDEDPYVQYKCHVVDYQNLYSFEDDDKIRISFRLCASAYTEDCHYDLDQARERLKVLIRGSINNTEQPEYFDTFMNRVRGLCIEHELEMLRK